MKYLKKYQDFGSKINEATGADVTKLQITVQLSEYKAGETYKKGIVGACTFIYDGKPLNAAPMNFTFLDATDRFVYSTTQSIKLSETSSLTGPFKMGALKKNVSTDGKITIGNYGAEQNTWALNLNKMGTAWMAQAIVVPSGGNTPQPLQPFNEKISGTFAPNVDVIDEAKKADVNAVLDKFATYYDANKDALTKPGASDGYTFSFTGGASQVTTTYQGGNAVLAQNRAKNLKTYAVEYYKGKNRNDIANFVSNVSEVSPAIIGKTPYVQGTDNPLDPKFTAEQYVSMSINVK